MILWKPTGNLDVATDSPELPQQQGVNGEIISGAMTRSKNLRLDQQGIAKTRYGSSKVNSSALVETEMHRIIEQAGVRFAFAGDQIFRNESSIASGLTSAQWSAIKYNQFNQTSQSIYALNGTDRKRIEGSTVYEWGITEPSAIPTIAIANATAYSLLLHMNGRDQATIFEDSGGSAHTVTANGNAQIDTAFQKFGTGSGLFDGTGDYLTIPDHADFDLSAGTWTIDFWVKPDSVAPSQNQVFYYQQTDVDNSFRIYLSTVGSIYLLCLSGGVGVIQISTPILILNPNAWNHISVVENGNNFYIFVNGVLSATGSDTDRPANYTGDINIANIAGGGVSAFNGWLDEFRIWKGTAAWTANFTPPTSEYSTTISGITGNYKYKYTYARKSGTTVVIESNPSDECNQIQMGNQIPTVSWTASGDSQVTHVRLYRTLNNGETFYRNQDIAIGTTSVVDTIADAALGTEVETNHERPPLGSFVAGPNYNGICFIIKDNNLYFCLAKRPEYWPTENFIEVSAIQDPGVCLIFHDGQPYFLTKHEIYQIQGTGAETFFPIPLKAITGAQGPNGAMSVSGIGIFHVGTDGIYLFINGLDKKLTQANFDPIFKGETVDGMPGMTASVNNWLFRFKNKVYCGYTSSGYTYPSNILVLNLDTMRISYYSYGREIRALCMDEDNDRILAGDNLGFIWELEDSSATDDGGTAIPWETESKEFGLQTQSIFPNSVKYDVNSASATTAKGEVILNGTVQQTHTLNDNRNVRKRLISGGNGNRLSLRLSGTGPVTIHAVQIE